MTTLSYLLLEVFGPSKFLSLQSSSLARGGEGRGGEGRGGGN